MTLHSRLTEAGSANNNAVMWIIESNLSTLTFSKEISFKMRKLCYSLTAKLKQCRDSRMLNFTASNISSRSHENEMRIYVKTCQKEVEYNKIVWVWVESSFIFGWVNEHQNYLKFLKFRKLACRHQDWNLLCTYLSDTTRKFDFSSMVMSAINPKLNTTSMRNISQF